MSELDCWPEIEASSVPQKSKANNYFYTGLYTFRSIIDKLLHEVVPSRSSGSATTSQECTTAQIMLGYFSSLGPFLRTFWSYAMRGLWRTFFKTPIFLSKWQKKMKSTKKFWIVCRFDKKIRGMFCRHWKGFDKENKKSNFLSNRQKSGG